MFGYQKESTKERKKILRKIIFSYLFLFQKIQKKKVKYN